MWTTKPPHTVDKISFIFFDPRSDLEAERKKHEKKDQEHKERCYSTVIHLNTDFVI